MSGKPLARDLARRLEVQPWVIRALIHAPPDAYESFQGFHHLVCALWNVGPDRVPRSELEWNAFCELLGDRTAPQWPALAQELRRHGYHWATSKLDPSEIDLQLLDIHARFVDDVRWKLGDPYLFPSTHEVMGSPTLRQWLSLSHRFPSIEIEAQKRLAAKGRIAVAHWPPLFEGELTRGQTSIRCVRSGMELAVEAAKFKNCAFSYLDECAAGNLFVVVVRVSGVRAAMAALRLAGDEGSKQSGFEVAEFESMPGGGCPVGVLADVMEMIVGLRGPCHAPQLTVEMPWGFALFKRCIDSLGGGALDLYRPVFEVKTGAAQLISMLSDAVRWEQWNLIRRRS